MDDMSYERKVRRMQELEEQLARERAKLQEMEQQHSRDKTSESRGDPEPGDGRPAPKNSSFIQNDALNDLQMNGSGYSENLLLPDDGISQGEMDSLPSLTQQLEPDTLSSFENEEMKLPEVPAMNPISTRDPSFDTPGGATDGANLDSNGVDLEIQEYRREIDEFGNRGYNVSRMYNVFSQDIDTIRRSIVQIMGDVNKLKGIEHQLDELDVTGFESDASSLRALLKNPEMVENARTFFEGLRDRIGLKETRERASRIREVEDLFEETLKEFSDVVDLFEEPIQDIKVSIVDMETVPVAEYRIVKKMIFDLKDAMFREKLAKEKEDEKRSIHEDLNKWSRKGFTVSEIETVMKQDMKRAFELYREFLTSANRLLELETELNKMDITGFENETREIREIIKETDKIFLVENKMESLKRRIRLSGIQTKMGRIRSSVASKRKGPSQMTCPKCSGVVPIPSDERPMKVNCSSCHTEYHLKRIPSSPPAATSPSVSEDGGIPVTPMKVDASAPIKVTTMSSGSQISSPDAPVNAPAIEAPACPDCGAALLPDSVFCGLCGHRMD